MNRNIIINILTICCLLFGIKNAFSQEDLKALLQGKTKLSEIMPVVNQYYADHPEHDEAGEESHLLQWNRWAWYMSGRLGHGGEFVNIPDLLFQGLSEKDKMEMPHERNINSAWTFMGPSTTPLQNSSAQGNGIGRVDRIVFHPTNANIIFICTPAGGLWSTLNGGTSWNNLTDNLPSLGVSGFVISYANTSIMYMLTGDGDSNLPLGLVRLMGYMRPSIGVLKSTDGGVSWHQTGNFPNVTDLFVGYQLVQSPTDPEILIACTSNGLYRTTNGGTTWTREFAVETYDAVFKPGDGTRVYAAVPSGVLVSTNSGDTFSSISTYDINPVTCGGGRVQLAVTPANANRVYLISGPKTGIGTFCGLWLSENSGTSFTRQSNSPNVLGGTDTGIDSTDQSEYDLAIACLPSLANAIVVAGCTVWRSGNSGGSWIHCTSYFEGQSFPYIHPDVHDLAYNPLNSYLYAATDGGFFKSQDFGVTWTNLSPNIETSQFYHLAGWDGNINKLMGGLQDNGVKYRKDNTSAFYHLSCCDGFDVVFNPDTGQPAHATYNDSYVNYYSDGTIDSAWTLNAHFFFHTLAIHNTNPDTILLGAFNIWKSIDGGTNWLNKGGSASWALTSCPSNSARFYSAGSTYFWGDGSGSLYFSGNTGEVWTSKSGNPGFPDPANWTKITDVEVRPTNSSTVWACFGGFDNGYKVVTSTNAGDSWTNMSGNLPNVPVNCLAIDNDNGVYAGTDIGVFYRGPTMPNWMPWSNGLPNVPVTELVIYDDGTTKKIRAATFGRGVWQGDLAATCDAAVVVTGGLEGIRHYEASTSITSTGFIQGGIGTFVSFQSGSYITLSDGFNVVDDSEFLGFISPCGQGGIPSAQGGTGTDRSNPNSSIILLRRMWDKEDGLPFGSIKQIDINGNTARVEFKLKKPGKVQLYAAREVQDKLETLYSGELSNGVHKMDFDISNLPHEFHYLLLFYEGKLAHFQEMDLGSKSIR